ncbi:hypothetical protein B0H66DRAFT_110619 [Apodospora peruviana]|uniref:Uncharacterized protein n=1 Tax=Apodospora peruviana TaxID=516989 RepID=A0AAE0IIT0_9PEZI|nr:hypothetical protein B0H66DRAFT_110619 [Apodospora peruviana]
MSSIAITSTAFGLQAILIIPLLVLGVSSARNVKKNGDQARRGIIWFHAGFWLFFMSLFLSTISWSFTLAGFSGSWYHDYGQWEAASHIESVGSFFAYLAYIAIMVCIAELAMGVKLVTNQVESNKFSVFIRVLSAIATVLWVTCFIFTEVRLASYYRSGVELAYFIIAIVFLSCLVIGAISVTVFTFIQRRTTRRVDAGVDAQTGNFLAITVVLFLISILWSVVMGVLFGFVFSLWWYEFAIPEVFLRRWLISAILFLIYRLGRKKTGGLWSNTTSAPKDSDIE